jgi:transcription elongation factor S-II
MSDADAAGGRLKKKLSAAKSIEKTSKARAAPPSPASVASPTSGDAMRDKVRRLLADALFRPDDRIVDGRAAADRVAADVETAMFDQLKGVSADYKMKLRELKFNLSDGKNRDLREEVLTGSLGAADVVRMASKDLANAEKKEERRKMHEHNMREAAAGNKPAASTNEFRCGKCRKRECTYYQMQTRGADEPLTTFVHCVNCDNRWRF